MEIVHGKGLTSLGHIPPHLLCFGFLHGEGGGGQTTGGTASLLAAVLAVRMVDGDTSMGSPRGYT